MNDVETTDIPSGPTSTQSETGSTVAIVADQKTLQSMTSDIAHVHLFGSFLICGTLVGAILFRRFVK